MKEENVAGLNRPLLISYIVAAASALALVVAPLLNLHCEACSGGLLSLSLPWMGIVFYSAMALIAVRSPASSCLSMAPGLYLFVHACLVTEMALMRRPCLGCLAVAACATAAAVCQLRGNPTDRLASGGAIVLGIVAAFFSPFDKADDLVTRKLWPARTLEAAPSWVNRQEMANCEHRFAARLLIYEKDCKS